MNRLSSFFLFCAGAESSILQRTPTDRNKYISIGATVFFTGIFATIAGGFALHSVFHSLPISILFGLLWGLMIFNLDRYIVMSIKKKGNAWQELGMAVPRLVLAILIAFVIAKPLELKLFESEIKSELVLKEQSNYKVQETALRDRYLPEISRLESDITALMMQIETKRTKRDDLNAEAIAEADGTGGSGNKNIGPIYKAKKKDADLAQAELDATIDAVSPLISQTQARLDDTENTMAAALVSLKKTNLDGFAAQLDALGSLSKKSNTIFWASLFITLLFIAIETAPLFVKLVSARSPYDYRLDQHEALVEHIHASYVNKLQTSTRNEIQYANVTKRYETLESIAGEKEIIKSVITNEVADIKEKRLTWEEYRQLGRRFG